MLELLSTRQNPMVDPLLHVWGWEIPVYLFLGGWVAGCMVISGWLLRRERATGGASVLGVLPWAGLVLISAGMLALFLDLEHKLYVWRIYLAFEPTSPMSWGAWILLLVYPVLALTGLVTLRASSVTRWPALASLRSALDRPAALRVLGLAGIVGGIGLGIYTGILLSSLGARPLWASGVLGPLFLVSGLSTGAAFAHMVARDAGERATLLRSDNLFLLIELVLIVLFLISLATAGEAQAQAAGLLLGGPYTAVFWVLVVGLGLLLPLALQTLMVSHRIGHTLVAPVLVMGGGLALRFVLVAAGQASAWPS